jgi:hypothetical protein
MLSFKNIFWAKENGKTKIKYPLGTEGRKCKKIPHNKTTLRPKKEHGNNQILNQPRIRKN